MVNPESAHHRLQPLLDFLSSRPRVRLIGRKVAQRLVLELKDRLGPATDSSSIALPAATAMVARIFGLAKPTRWHQLPIISGRRVGVRENPGALGRLYLLHSTEQRLQTAPYRRAAPVFMRVTVVG